MRTLAIDTATEACSVALFEDDKILDHRHEVLGRGHAERLVPMIAELPEKGRADRILVSLGPGSFTGVRIGLAVGRALGIAWKAEVLGYPTLALVAAMARGITDKSVTVCMTGGHGEWFVQDIGGDGLPSDRVVSITQDAASRRGVGDLIAGSQAEALGARLNVVPEPVTLPDARYALAVPEQLFTRTLSPLYGRPPDAKLPGA